MSYLLSNNSGTNGFRQIHCILRQLTYTAGQYPETPRQSYRRAPLLQKELSSSSCTPFHSVCLFLDGQLDLILALELLLMLKAARVLSFSGITNFETRDFCLCLISRGQQR